MGCFSPAQFRQMSELQLFNRSQTEYFSPFSDLSPLPRRETVSFLFWIFFFFFFLYFFLKVTCDDLARQDLPFLSVPAR